MSNSSELVIWIPLSPKNSWNGEGISRTIENILEHLPRDIICQMVVSKNHALELAGLAAKYPNIQIKTFGFTARYKNVKKGDTKNDGTIEFIITKIKPLSWLRKKLTSGLVQRVQYVFYVHLYAFLQRWNLFLPDRKVFWIPVPGIPALGWLRAKKIFSFWDPFVFEYKDFADINAFLFKHFASLYRDAELLITQSQANKDFLTNVFQVSPEKIEIINNGNPDYSEFYNQLDAIGRRNKDGLLNLWAKSEYLALTYKEANNKQVHDLLNKSILWRLLYKLTPRDRVLMISTQIRPYKGFNLLLEFLNNLVQNETEFRYQFIFTAELSDDMRNLYPALYERIHEITRVSNPQHALLYYISDLVMHPSYVEGGRGVYPQFEAASVGTPSLVNLGRHVFEQSPQAMSTPTHYAVDFTNTQELQRRIHELMSSEEARQLNLMETRQLSICWADSAKKYGETFKKVMQHG